jgi:hypothetical protein
MTPIRAARARAEAPTAPVATPHLPPYRDALIAGGAVFALYALTLAPTTAFWDASEYIATAHIVGIPHPPGNPLFVLMARAWELLLAPTGLATAVKINLFSALMTAGASVFWFLVLHRILAFFSSAELVRRAGAAAGVLVAATAFTVWNQSNVNEKVYTVSLLTIALLSWLAFLWRDHVEFHRGLAEKKPWHDDNAIVLMVFLLALSVGNHLMAFLAAPALALFIFLVRPASYLNWKLYAWCALFGVLGLTVHLFLPLRSALDPVINQAAPVCESVGDAMKSIVTFGNAGCEDLSAALQREQYAKPPLTERQAPFAAQMATFFQYFDWQWSRSLQSTRAYFAPARLPFTMLFLLLGLFGAVEHWRRDRRSFAYLGTLIATLTVGLVVYMNFKYGFGQANATGVHWEMAEVRERDYFFLVGFSAWGLWVGVGLVSLWLRAAAALPGNPRALLTTSPVLAVALLPLVLNWSHASRAGDFAARDWAYNLLQSVEPYGVLFTNGDNDTFPLWYLQEVEGIRRDVTVMVYSYLNTPWYVRQLRDLTRPCPEADAWARDVTRITCQRPFVAEAGADIYGSPALPAGTAIPVTDEQIAAATTLGGAFRTDREMLFQVGAVRAAIPAGTVITPADQFILTIIREAGGERPIHFATTTNTHRKLGLEPFLVRQGFTFRLIDPEQVAPDSYLAIPREHPYAPILGAYVDVERMRTLLDEVWIYRDLADRHAWVDDPTRGIPSYYAHAFLALAQAEAMLGNDEAADRYLEVADRWMELSQR